MDRPNLFNFATSELSQDAFICWLLCWADRGQRATDESLHQTAIVLLHRLLALHKIDPPPECESLKIEKQYKGLDILVLVNDDLVLPIEDKVYASEHSDQLRRYVDAVRVGFPGRKVAPVYLKTGEQSSYRSVEQAGFARFGRSELLRVLEHGERLGVRNDIYTDYHRHLKKMEEFGSWMRVLVSEWGRDARRWIGFFVALKERLGEGTWRQVPNRRGGFVGFVWYEKGGKYIALHEKELCFRISVAEKADQEAAWKA